MLKVHIQSLPQEGREFELVEKAEKLTLLYDEFFDNVLVTGKVRVHSDRYSITGNATCTAQLECDLSLEPFQEQVKAEFKLTAIKSDLGAIQSDNIDTIYLAPEDNYIDISDIVSESLSLALPMKRLAPKFRGKELKDLHPNLINKKNEKEDGNKSKDTWAVLKNIKLN